MTSLHRESNEGLGMSPGGTHAASGALVQYVTCSREPHSCTFVGLVRDYGCDRSGWGGASMEVPPWGNAPQQPQRCVCRGDMLRPWPTD